LIDLPNRITVELTAPSPDVDLEGILVFVGFRVRGDYYFGSLLGLTDKRGCVTRGRAEIAEDFALEQREFPMDYKVPLTECDPELEVEVLGGHRFATQREQGRDLDFIPAATHELWNRARNVQFRTVRHAIQLNGTTPRDLRISVRVEPLPRRWGSRPAI
jgi:hypothetical protein